MTIRFRIKETFTKIKKNISSEITKLSSKLFQTNKNKVSGYLRTYIYEAVYNCPEMESVRDGILKADFGLNFDPTGDIANSVAQSVNIDVDTRNRAGNIVGGYNINVQPITYLNLLNLPTSIIITEKDEELPWLDWLLNYGDAAVVYNYRVLYKNNVGRSEMAIMVPSSRFFRVNEQFSGTMDNNFITRAISDPSFINNVRLSIDRALN
jgi:hypothetical protein